MHSIFCGDFNINAVGLLTKWQHHMDVASERYSTSQGLSRNPILPFSVNLGFIKDGDVSNSKAKRGLDWEIRRLEGNYKCLGIE